MSDHKSDLPLDAKNTDVTILTEEELKKAADVLSALNNADSKTTVRMMELHQRGVFPSVLLPHLAQFNYGTLTVLIKNKIDVPVHKVDMNRIIVAFYKHGDLDVLKWLLEKGYLDKNNRRVAEWLVIGDHFECLKYLLEFGFIDTDKLRPIVIASGNLKCIDLLPLKSEYSDLYLMHIAIRHGRLEYLKKSPEFQPSMKNLERAIRYGQLEVAKYIVNELECFSCEQSSGLMNVAVKHGHLDCVKFLRELGLKWESNTMNLAYRSKNKDLIKYLFDNGCPFHMDLLPNYADEEFLDFIKIVQ